MCVIMFELELKIYTFVTNEIIVFIQNRRKQFLRHAEQIHGTSPYIKMLQIQRRGASRVSSNLNYQSEVVTNTVCFFFSISFSGMAKCGSRKSIFSIFDSGSWICEIGSVGFVQPLSPLDRNGMNGILSRRARIPRTVGDSIPLHISSTTAQVCGRNILDQNIPIRKWTKRCNHRK